MQDRHPACPQAPPGAGGAARPPVARVPKANTLGGLRITIDSRGVNKPATSVSWFEAATFVNWLNTFTGATPAYKFSGSTFQLWQSGDAGFDASNPYRNSQALYFLPSADEWYKAAYYDPVAGAYNQWPTGSTSPFPVASGTTANTAVFGQPTGASPADIMSAGGLSPYGTLAQGGNVWEWYESAADGVNDSPTETRSQRGGNWSSCIFNLDSAGQFFIPPQFELDISGFRVAMAIPEPSRAMLAMTGLAAAFLCRRR